MNARLPRDVVTVLGLIASKHDISKGKLAEQVLTAYAIEAARALVLETEALLAEAQARHDAEVAFIENLGHVAALEIPAIIAA